MKRHMF